MRPRLSRNSLGERQEIDVFKATPDTGEPVRWAKCTLKDVPVSGSHQHSSSGLELRSSRSGSCGEAGSAAGNAARAEAEYRAA